MDTGKGSEFRTVRGYQLANQHAGQLTPALEDYLEMAYRLCAENGYARVGQLSESLNVRPSSASKMIFKLSSLGYLQSDRYEIIRLTESGRARGCFLLSRHETVEHFLELIGSSHPLEETELVEHTLSSATVTALQTLNAFFTGNEEFQRQFTVFRETTAASETIPRLLTEADRGEEEPLPPCKNVPT